MAVKLFVGGLSFSTSNDRLREAFAAVGTVESASIVTDRDTGRSRGFGFVEMATPEDADQAINRLNGSSLDGRTIQVERAKSPGAASRSRQSGSSQAWRWPWSGFPSAPRPLMQREGPRPSPASDFSTRALCSDSMRSSASSISFTNSRLPPT